jgi:hypothetical protein
VDPEVAEEHHDGDEVEQSARQAGMQRVQRLLLARVRPRVVRPWQPMHVCDPLWGGTRVAKRGLLWLIY